MDQRGRRSFLRSSLALLGLGLLSGCGLLPSRGPSVPRLWRIGYLSAGSAGPDPFFDAFVERLHELGYVEGQAYQLEAVFAEGQLARLPEFAAELVRRNPDVILTGGTVQSLAVKQATSTIPIVFANPSDPVSSGLVASLAHPGGNLTGLSTSNREVTAKRLQLLKDAFPNLTTVGVLFNPEDLSNQQSHPLVLEGAEALGLAVVDLGLSPRDTFAEALQRASQAAADGFVCEASPFFGQHRAQIAEALTASGRPAIYAQREFVLAGGLLSYAADYAENYRRAADYVDKILKGANPANLPVEQPTTFEFVVNLRTARALGLTIPTSVLQQATEVLQ